MNAYMFDAGIKRSTLIYVQFISVEGGNPSCHLMRLNAFEHARFQCCVKLHTLGNQGEMEAQESAY